ncbi:DUF1295 domain-containing protein [Rhodococcus sp. PvR099]|uniref:DUF1295 domain-containing protein n=1 Tax=Rhodococcus sp. PvR099 TaxID=2806602 RepID=UPI001AE2CDE7|nr:DUF1295 domain-containing protein [Rhodococcus sp. PvR099]MBP1160454.1 steroid 5-alpha reductase family enzyme [Rhodococcus sp. PvR099]
MNATGPAGFAAVSVTGLLVLVLLQAATFAIGRRIGRYNVVDVSWGLGFVLVAVVAATVGGGDVTRRVLLVLLVAVWGLRLSWHMHVKSRGRGEDPRYEELLARSAGSRTVVVIRKIFLTQGAAQWFVSLPLQLSAVLGATHGPGVAVLGLGAAVWVVGFVFEAVGDSQLERFKAEPANRGRVMDVGLWAWTRHPNYFGDACVWWGLWLVAASVWPGPLTIASPVLMTYFLVYATGARLLEKSMSQRPGYAEYQARTGFFVPRPPRPS